MQAIVLKIGVFVVLFGCHCRDAPLFQNAPVFCLTHFDETNMTRHGGM